MRIRTGSTLRTAAATVAAGTLLTGAVAVGAGQAAADGIPNGPWCHGPAKVLAESDWSQVAICSVQGPTGWAYRGVAKTTGAPLEIYGATENQYGFHATNNGYTYHVHRDRLLITAPNGAVISDEPWNWSDWR